MTAKRVKYVREHAFYEAERFAGYVFSDAELTTEETLQLLNELLNTVDDLINTLEMHEVIS